MNRRVKDTSVTGLTICPTCGGPTTEARLALKAGRCPLCGAGPYRVPLHHIAMKHGIGRKQARRLFGFGADEPACHPSHSELHRRLALAIRLGADQRKD